MSGHTIEFGRENQKFNIVSTLILTRNKTVALKPFTSKCWQLSDKPSVFKFRILHATIWMDFFFFPGHSENLVIFESSPNLYQVFITFGSESLSSRNIYLHSPHEIGERNVLFVNNYINIIINKYLCWWGQF